MGTWLGIAGRWAGRTLFTVLAVAVAAYAFTYLGRPFERGNAFAVRFAISGLDVPLHFFLAGLSLVLAPVQLSAPLRRRWPALHRLCGWLYAASVLIGSAAGFSLALHAQGGLPSRTAFILLALLWPTVTGVGIGRAIVGDIHSHRRWMCRSVALTYSAVTLRLILVVCHDVLQWPFHTVYIASAWLGWSVNLVICELWLRRTGTRASRGALSNTAQPSMTG